jgi:hypothetical protein
MSGRTLNPQAAGASPAPKKTMPLSRRGVAPGAAVAEECAPESGALDEMPGAGFALLSPRNPSTVILDDDQAREWLTRWLLSDLAPALGLDPAKIEIRVNAEAAARADARGASGLAENGRVYLHPSRYSPAAADGRKLLAHEVAHVAQSLNHAAGPIDTPLARQNAEHEAGRIAESFAAREVIRRPVAAIPAHASAADVDFSEKLEQAVAAGRAREISAIKRLLSGLWISDGDVFGVLRILETMDFAVARAVVHALGRTGRYELCDNINVPHIVRMRRQVLACYDALEDNEFGAIDADVLAEGPLSGLDRQEKSAALRTIQHLSAGDKRGLLRSNNRREIKALILAPEAMPPDPREIAEEEKRILEKEQDLAKSREEIGALLHDKGTEGILGQVREILNDSKREPRRNAVLALDLLAGQRGSRARFLAIAERMDAEGLIDTVLYHLPEWRFFDTVAHSETLVALMESRLAIKNVDFVEELLSYGLFDWAIRDYEAKFAYRIIKLLPLSEQYRFRQRDNGKWYMRLVQNLPEEFTAGADFRGDIEVRKASREEIARLRDEKKIRTEDEYYDAAQLYQQKKSEAGVSEQTGALKKAFEEAKKAGKPEAAYQELHKRVAAVGGASWKGGKFSAADHVLMETVVHELDRFGYIETLFKELPDSFLFSETSRIATVKIMMARDPARVQYHARRLASRRFLDWMVTDREAYLAYLCVKALPDDERAAFLERESGVWSDILGEMSRDMRDSSDLNFYVGDKEGRDRGSVLGQLAESSTWHRDNVARLDGLLHMAIAMTEHKFAFERSEEFQAYADTALKPLVTKYRLYDPKAKRTKHTPEILKGTEWYEEGIFATLRTLWKGLVFLWENNFLLVTRSVGTIDMNLNQLQDVFGGDIGGAKLADPERDFGERPPNPAANRLTVLFDIGAHALLLRIPELRIDSVSFQGAGQTIQTGSILLRGLKIDVAYDTEEADQPTKARLDAERLEMRDLLISFREGMLAVNRFLLAALHIGAGTVDTTTPNRTKPRDGYYFPVPFLATLGTAIYYLFKFKGWGTEKPGLEQDHGLEQIRAIDFTFSNLEVDGLTSSGGQSIAKIAVTDFALRAGLNKTTMLRAKLDSLNRRIQSAKAKKDSSAVEKLEADKKKAEEDLAGLLQSEKRLLVIQNRILHGDLTEKEERALQEEIKTLDLESASGMFVDIGSIEAGGISGAVSTKKSIKLTDIHGEGTSPAGAASSGLSIITDAEVMRRVTTGERPPSMVEQGGEFRLELGDFHAEELSIGAGMRTSKDIAAKLKELEPVKEKYEFAPLYEHLQDLQVAAVRYEQYLAVGVSALNKNQLDDFRHLRAVLTKEPDIIFGEIDLQKAYLGLSTSGGVSLGAREGTLKNIRLPERGISVDEVKAVDIKASANVKGGLAGWLDARKNIQGGALTAESLTITGARSDFHGLLADKVTITGREEGEAAGIQIDERGNKISVGFSVRAEGLGLVPRIGLLKQRLEGLKRKNATDPSPKTEKEIAKLTEDIATLEALAGQRAKAWALKAGAKTPEEKAAAEQAVMEAEGIIAIGLKQYGAASASLEGFGLEVTGAGDLLSDVLGTGIDPMSVLERGGVRAHGTGPDNRLFKRLSVSGAQTSSTEEDSSTSAGAGTFEIGETKLDVSAKKDGDSINVDVPQFEIASITVNQFLLTTFEGEKGYQLFSEGESGIQTVKFRGRVRLDARTKGSRDLADYRLAHVRIDEFRIGKIHGTGLGFASFANKFEVLIKSGSITGVHAEGMDIDLPEDPKAPPVVTGTAGIDSIDNVVIGKAIAGAWAVDHGRINARKLDVEFLKDGGIEASIGDLSLTAISMRGPDGWARFSLSNLGGKLRYKDGVLDIPDLHLGSFDVSAMHWKVGKTGFVEADKPVRVLDVRIKARIETEQVPAKGTPAKPAEPGEKERKLKKVKVTNLHVGTVTAEHLVYQDEENRVELKPYDAKDPATKHMAGFKPTYLSNLDVWDVEWSKDAGFSKGHASLEKYETSLAYEDLKSGMKAGVALTGGGMKAEVLGPGIFGGEIGKIDKIRGNYHDDKIDTKFAIGPVVGSVAMGPDFVEASNVQIAGLNLGGTAYKDPPSRKLEVKNPFVEKITLGKIRQNYKKSEEAGKEGEKVPTTLDVTDLVMTNISTGRLVYDGESRGMTADGKETVSTQHIEGTSVHIERLNISKLVYDKAKAETILSMKVESDDPKGLWSPFSVRGLTANLVEKIGDKETSKKLVTNVEGGPLTCQNVKFTTVKLGTAPGPGGKPEDVTRTKIEGAFNLTRLGFINPYLTLTDEKGKQTFIKPYGGYGTVELTNVNPQFLPNGTARVPIDSLVATKIKVQRGDASVEIPFLEIKDIALGLKGMGTDKGIDLLAAKLGSIRAKGLLLRIEKTRKAEMSDAEYAEALAEWEAAQKEPTGGKLVAEPLSGLSGEAEGELSLAWWEDPDLMPKVQNGIMNMHGATNYSVMIEKDKLTLGNFRPKKTVLEFGRDLPGVYPGAGPAGYGQINIRELVEGLFNEPASKPEKKYSPPAGLRNVTLKGSFSLGDGRMGIDQDDDKKLGQGDFWVEFARKNKNQNKIELVESNLGDFIQLRMPEFHFSGAGFTAGKTQEGKVRQGKTGEITLQGINVYVSGLANFKLTISLYVADGTIKDVEIGDVTFLEAANLKKIADPTLTEVNPKGTPLPKEEAKEK